MNCFSFHIEVKTCRICLSVSNISFLVLVGLGLNSELCACKAGVALLQTSSPFCFAYFGDGILGSAAQADLKL
jgi:hypothetical protein